MFPAPCFSPPPSSPVHQLASLAGSLFPYQTFITLWSFWHSWYSWYSWYSQYSWNCGPAVPVQGVDEPLGGQRGNYEWDPFGRSQGTYPKRCFLSGHMALPFLSVPDSSISDHPCSPAPTPPDTPRLQITLGLALRDLCTYLPNETRIFQLAPGTPSLDWCNWQTLHGRFTQIGHTGRPGAFSPCTNFISMTSHHAFPLFL